MLHIQNHRSILNDKNEINGKAHKSIEIGHDCLLCVLYFLAKRKSFTMVGAPFIIACAISR